MATRKWHMAHALTSVRALATVITDLTEEEVLAALDLESASQRRRSILERLIKRAIQLKTQSLLEKYLGPSF